LQLGGEAAFLDAEVGEEEGEIGEERGDIFTFTDGITDGKFLSVILSVLMSVKGSHHCTEILV
jgi:hypothetical protein